MMESLDIFSDKIKRDGGVDLQLIDACVVQCVAIMKRCRVVSVRARLQLRATISYIHKHINLIKQFFYNDSLVQQNIYLRPG